MEEYVYQIRSYLPVLFEADETNDFIEYLVAAYLENLPNEKYQFSFAAFHMLYMSYIYKTKWLLKGLGNAPIEQSLQDYINGNKGRRIVFNTLFDLSQIEEKTSLGQLLTSLSFHVNTVDTCKNLVEVRNKCLHASGEIYFKRQNQFENYIQEELDNIAAVQNKMKPFLQSVFDTFITEKWNTNWIETDIQNWIMKNYLSQKDIEQILEIKPSFLRDNSDNRETVYKKLLYSVLVDELVKNLDDRGEYFTKSLVALAKGLTPQIDIRANPDDDEKLKNTQELIEEKIAPILPNLPSAEFQKAQEILSLNSVD